MTLELVLPSAPLVVLADPSRFDQAIVNLVINARDALISERGRIRVTAALADDLLNGERAVRISVEDDGVGMDEATQTRIFAPFFTTKGRDRGTGLGLSIVHGAITLAGGEIHVSSHVGQGTRFDILLPLHGTEAPEIVSLTTEFPVQDNSRHCVLIVDDDPQVRRVAVRLMERRGFAVREAAGAEAALALQAQQDTTVPAIDILLTDLVMPGMSGRTLARLLRERVPRLAVVYMSGYDDDGPETAKDFDTPFVSKPFNETQLMLGVREALNRRVA
jgi:CheY-like chemotaxis protein